MRPFLGGLGVHPISRYFIQRSKTLFSLTKFPKTIPENCRNSFCHSGTFESYQNSLIIFSLISCVISIPLYLRKYFDNTEMTLILHRNHFNVARIIPYIISTTYHVYKKCIKYYKEQRTHQRVTLTCPITHKYDYVTLLN
jgi:hypothetical protein